MTPNAKIGELEVLFYKVCDKMNVVTKYAGARSGENKRKVPRGLYYYLAKRLFPYTSFSQIGDNFLFEKSFNHATVMHGIGRIEDQINHPYMKRELAIVNEILEEHEYGVTSTEIASCKHCRRELSINEIHFNFCLNCKKELISK